MAANVALVRMNGGREAGKMMVGKGEEGGSFVSILSWMEG